MALYRQVPKCGQSSVLPYSIAYGIAFFIFSTWGILHETGLLRTNSQLENDSDWRPGLYLLLGALLGTFLIMGVRAWLRHRTAQSVLQLSRAAPYGLHVSKSRATSPPTDAIVSHLKPEHYLWLWSHVAVYYGAAYLSPGQVPIWMALGIAWEYTECYAFCWPENTMGCNGLYDVLANTMGLSLGWLTRRVMVTS
jgi:hypothetical protein